MDLEEFVAQSSFSMLQGKLCDSILKALETMGYEKPTKIQAQTLPHLLQGQDLIGAAKTGSGKTLAFLIPCVDRLIKLGFKRNHGKCSGCMVMHNSLFRVVLMFLFTYFRYWLHYFITYQRTGTANF